VFLFCGKNLTLCGVLYISQNNMVINTLIKFQFDSYSFFSSYLHYLQDRIVILSWLLRGVSSSMIFHFPFLVSNDIAR